MKITMKIYTKIECKYCKKLFDKNPRGGKKYCSTKCYRLASRKRKQLKCKKCNKKFEAVLSLDSVFCSKECSIEYNKGENHYGYKGGHKTKDGYMVISVNNVQMLQHRYLVEQNIGRRLHKAEHVHHLNGIRDDNRLENLVVVSCNDHLPESTKLIIKLNHRIRELEAIIKAHDEDVKK